MRNAPWYPIESADNVLRLLLLLSEQRQVRVVEAAEHLGVARSTAHRLLRALSYRDFAVQDAHKAYRPGPAFERLVLPGPSTQDLRAVLHRHVERLHAELGETCHLMVLEGNGARFIDCVECTHVLRIGSRVGVLLPAHVTSGGKALLAALDDERLEQLFPEEDLVPLNPRSLTSRAELFAELDQVRAAGYATNRGESEMGIAAVAMVQRTARGVVAAALAVSAPEQRLPEERVPLIVEALRDVTERARLRLP